MGWTRNPKKKKQHKYQTMTETPTAFAPGILQPPTQTQENKPKETFISGEY